MSLKLNRRSRLLCFTYSQQMFWRRNMQRSLLSKMCIISADGWREQSAGWTSNKYVLGLQKVILVKGFLDLEDSIARRKMAMRGFKSMSSISTKQNANNHYNAEDDTWAGQSAIAMSYLVVRVQMLRLAVLDQYIARSSSAIETSSIKVPPKVSSIKSKKFSQSMPAKVSVLRRFAD